MEQLKTTLINYGDGIYAVDQQMVRAFLIVGSRKALLLDTGAVKTDILSIIGEITALPVEVVLTHGDGDHLGNLSAFADAYINKNDMAAVRSHEGCAGVELHPLNEGDVFDVGGRTLRVLLIQGTAEHTRLLLYPQLFRFYTVISYSIRVWFQSTLL